MKNHERYEKIQFVWEGLPGQMFGSTIEKHLEEIGKQLYLLLPELNYDEHLQMRLYRIWEKLTDDPSLHRLSSEDLDLFCMCLNTSLDIAMSDFDAE
jgi:hypothetical protein